jgi:hypothetical protein
MVGDSSLYHILPVSILARAYERRAPVKLLAVVGVARPVNLAGAGTVVVRAYSPARVFDADVAATGVAAIRVAERVPIGIVDLHVPIAVVVE